MQGSRTLDTRNLSITLSDGRRLGYAEYGTPDAAALLYFHGTPGSRLDGESDMGGDSPPVHLICPDRPGIGLSDRQRHRTMQDWPLDVRQLVDHLSIDRFAVAGGSAGGPYALACAAALPDRVTTVGLISSATPPDVESDGQQMHAGNRLAMALITHTPWLLRPFFGSIGLLSKHWPEALVKLGLKALPESDRKVMLSERYRRVMRGTLAEPYRQGSGGVIDDAVVDRQPWSFDLSGIAAPVFQWHGTEDRNVPIAEARQLAEQIPSNHFTELPGLGHLLLPALWPELVRSLT
jgi:pimeloyl-ACP methyl ester carboxylesterase